jgi:hypothetical protein
MIPNFYFFDQFSRASHIGGVCRSKRDLKDLDQALYHVKIASTIDDDHSDQKETITSNPLKKQTDDVRLPTNPPKLKAPIIPEILTKELDKIFQLFDEKSKPNSASSDQSRSRRSSEQSIENEKPLINPTSNLPKISLPSLLIVQLHSTWSDLIQNTQYKYKVKQRFLLKKSRISFFPFSLKRFGVQKLVKKFGVNMFKKNVQNN